MEQVTKPAEDPVLGNEGAAGTTPEEGVYGSMVVKKQVYGGVVTVGRHGEGTNSAIEFSRLLDTIHGGHRKNRMPMEGSQTPT